MQERMILEAAWDETRGARPQAPDAGKWLLIALVLVAGIFTVRQFMGGPAAALAGWGEDWDRGIDLSARTGRPMLVLFTADWCGPCRQLKRDVLARKDVAARLRAGYTLVKIDLTRPDSSTAGLARDYGVSGVPTLMLFSTRGEQLGRLSGAVSADDLLNWLSSREPASAKP